MLSLRHIFFFFFNDTATTEIYTLSLHDALPISIRVSASIRPLASRPPSARLRCSWRCCVDGWRRKSQPTIRSSLPGYGTDRKSTRLNSSHLVISYAVFCLKKKKKNISEVPEYSC